MASQLSDLRANGQTNGTVLDKPGDLDDELDLLPERSVRSDAPVFGRSMSMSTASEVSSDHEELNEGALLDNAMATAFGGKEFRGSTRRVWKDVLAYLNNESRGELPVSRVASDGEIAHALTFACGVEGGYLRELFPSSLKDEELRLEHQLLPEVLRQIFVEHNIEVPQRHSNLQKLFNRAETNSIIVWCRQMPCLRLLKAKAARKLVSNPVFTGWFIVLTLYALFVPDFVVWALRSGQDDFFTVINTIVWFFFVIEIFILMRGVDGYWRSIPCVLDLVAMLSFISETWFVKSEIFGGADGDRAARMTRQTRLTRLARVIRVARITKLLPKIMSCFGHQKTEITNYTLERRLWRSFRYLDGAHTGEITMFDVNILYLSLLQECQRMIGLRSKAEVLREDVPKLRGLTVKAASLSFGGFLAIFRSSLLGKCMYDFHLKDLQDSTGSYAMTHDVADRSSLKVCIGILVLIIMMKLLDAETAETEESPVQLLGMLETSTMANYGKEFLYAQIREYISDNKAMFVLINGMVYFDRTGSAINDPTVPMSIDTAFEAADRIQEQSGLRTSEVLLACIPDSEKCSRDDVRSVALVNIASTTRTDAAWALLQTIVIVGLLVIFIFAFNRGVGKFTKSLLRPLRAIVDDMFAMSCLDLVQIDIDEMPQEGGSVKEAQEAIHLQKAFRRMCVSIRSWSSYVPPVVVQRLMTCGMEATIGVSRCNVSILFVDINKFEDICRGLGPKDVLLILSSALGHVADVIEQHKGTLLEFIGDEAVAVFGAPAMLRNHSYHCASSAVQIHEAITRMHHVTLEDGTMVEFSCRSAVHTATVLAGNVGSKRRMKYGLLGDGVNLTARFKTLNSRYRTKTLATKQMMDDERVLADFIWRPIDRVAVKGKSEPTTVYEILASRESQEGAQLARACELHRDAFRLYQSRFFEEAKVLFHEVHSTLRKLGQEDEPSKQMIKRCNRFLINPPAPDWDGVERLTKKIFEVQDEPIDIVKNVIPFAALEADAKNSNQPAASRPFSAYDNTVCATLDEHLVHPPVEDQVQITPRMPRTPILCGAYYEQEHSSKVAPGSEKGFASLCRCCAVSTPDGSERPDVRY